ncbi:MAG: hypothetical protein E7496_00965 [Ruminococcus sp.]|nr:hypothetical protein [Ruminococcus sp.]
MGEHQDENTVKITNGGEGKNKNANEYLTAAGALGISLATVISYTNWHSILWAILHGALNWIYVIYYAIRY